jgi:hypothetical protein
MYCIKRDKCYSIDNTLCPFAAYYNQPVTPVVPWSMINPSTVQGRCCPYQNYPMPYNYSGAQRNSMYNPNYYSNDTIGNMRISMMPVPVEEIED